MTEGYRRSVPVEEAERLGHSAFTVEVRKGGPQTVCAVGRKIESLYIAGFKPVLEGYSFSTIPPKFALFQQLMVLEEHLNTPDTIVALLYKRKRKKPLVGFSYAYPERTNTQMYFKDPPKWTDYLALREKTAEMGATVITPQAQGEHGWRILMNALYGQIKDEGYKQIVRASRTQNGYDQKVLSHPGGEIIYTTSLTDPRMGTLQFTRVQI